MILLLGFLRLPQQLTTFDIFCREPFTVKSSPDFRDLVRRKVFFFLRGSGWWSLEILYSVSPTPSALGEICSLEALTEVQQNIND